MTREQESNLMAAAKDIRIDTLKLCHKCYPNGAHVGGCLSVVEILTVLFVGIMRISVPFCRSVDDRFVLSKGHAGLALYSALKKVGIISEKEFCGSIRGENATMFRHPKRNVSIGIEMTAGSLGQGLSYGVGLAVAMKKKGQLINRVFVILGDGECNEGAVWEAAAFASHLQLNNLVVIVDKNNLSLDGLTDEVMCMNSLEEKWRAFGFETISVDGHNVCDLYNAIIKTHDVERKKPLVVIANTVKGKGVSFAENAVEWHDKALDDLYFKIAVQEVTAG